MNSTEVFIHLNNEIHLYQGKLEQQAQQRFTEAIQRIWDFKKGEVAIEWLESPCNCDSCSNLSPRQPRWQLILNNIGYQHLLEQIAVVKRQK